MIKLTKIVIIFATYYLIWCTASSAFQNVLTKIFEEDGDHSISPFNFLVGYSFFMIGNVFAPLIKFHYKKVLALISIASCIRYALCFLLFVDNQPVKYLSSGFGAAIFGLAQSALWVCAGKYIHEACHMFDKLDEKGHYYGLFNFIFNFSGMIGGIVATFGLELLSHKNYFFLVTAICATTFLFALFCVENIENKEEQKSQSKKTIKQILLNTFRYYPIMYSCLGLIFVDGITIGIQYTTLLHLVPNTDDKKHDDLLTGFAVIAFGIGCIVGGYLGGKLCDVFKLKFVARTAVAMFVVGCILIFVGDILEFYPFTIFVCFYIGVLELYTQACQMVICSRSFGGHPQSFAVVKQFHCFSFVLYEIVALATGNSIPIKFIMPVLLLFAIPALVGLRKLPAYPDEAKESLVETQ